MTQSTKTELFTSELIYKLEDRPPLRDAIFAAFQHLLAIFVAIITPPLIIASALKLDLETTGYLISMSLLASGISTFIQCKKVGPIGCGLLCIQGTSFSFISPIIGAGLNGGLAAIFGAVISGSFIEMFISRVLRYTRQIITPLVSGIVVCLIGLSLIKVGVIACGGGFGAKADGTFASVENISLAALVIVTILFFNRSSNRYLRMSSIVLGLIIGFVVAYFMGRVDFSQIDSFGGINVPHPFKYGITFDPGAIIAGGILADGFNSMIAGCLNSFPNSIFAQNNGMIQLTGVASRYVGFFIAGFLVILGLFPAVGKVFSLIPDPVLGGATLLMFGTVAAAGVRIIASQEMNRKAILVMAVSFSFGLAVEFEPDILNFLPDNIKSLFTSGITTGGLVAIISNFMIRIKDDDKNTKGSKKAQA